MTIELKVPQVGESISEVQIGAWLKQQGERAEKDETLVEIETDKATVELPAPVSGVISRVMKARGQMAAVGEVIGYMEESADGEAKATASAAQKSAPAAEEKSVASTQSDRGPKREAAPERDDASEEEKAEQTPASQRGEASTGSPPPLPAQPAPDRTEVKSQATVSQAAANAPPVSPPAPSIAPAPAKHAPAAEPRGLTIAGTSPTGESAHEQQVVPMSAIRRRIAQRLVEAQHNAALLTTFNEIDMKAVMELRKEQGPAFQEHYGVKLGFMSFFVKATIEALKLVPQLNAEIQGEQIVYKNYYDIGIAIGGGKGLVVPVLHNAQRKSFAEIELAIADLANRARDNKITLDELEGGTFTISNGGIYGSLLSTPIVNPPQSGILGLHAIQDRPVAREGEVVIRPMMYVALTYDHRLVDGREAVTFLRRIKDIVENPMRMLLEV